MKKRSLFAAVAMLIVSAIVMTSATYAWFAVGGNATISAMTGNVAKSKSGVMLQTLASNAEWKNQLTYVDLASDTSNNKFATNHKDSGGNFVAPGTTGEVVTGEYVPVSMSNPNDSNALKAAYTISDHAYSETTVAGQTIADWYDCYTFRVAKVTEDTKNVDARVKVDGSAAQAARVAIYTSTDGGTTWTTTPIFVSGEAETTWKPIITALDTDATTGIKDKANGSGQYNYIVDEQDTNYVAGTLGSSATTCNDGSSWYTFTLTNPHAMGYNESGVTNTLVKVYVWIEGNDDDCYPNSLNVPGKSFNVEWGFKVTGESW